jgi:hypothetical protein
VLLRVLEQLLKTDQIPGVVIFAAVAWVVHHAEVHERRDLSIAEDFARFLASDIDLAVLDVLGTIGEWPPVEADHSAFTMKEPSNASSEPPADPRDDDGTGRHSIQYVWSE